MKVKSSKSFFGGILYRPHKIQNGSQNVKGPHRPDQVRAASSLLVIESVKTGRVLFSVNG